MSLPQRPAFTGGLAMLGALRVCQLGSGEWGAQTEAETLAVEPISGSFLVAERWGCGCFDLTLQVW